METKKCKFCQSDIDKKAKVCPNCKKDLRIWFAKHPIITVIGILIIIGILGGGTATSKNPATVTPTTKDSANVTPSTTVNSSQVTTAKIGDVIKTDKFEITITDISEKVKVGTEYLNKKPSEGATFVAVKIKYKNITTQPIGMFSQKPTINLVGPNNVEYNNDIDATSYYAGEVDPDSKIVSDLNPGITVNDAEVFEISKEDYAKSGWKLKVKSDKEAEIAIK